MSEPNDDAPAQTTFRTIRQLIITAVCLSFTISSYVIGAEFVQSTTYKNYYFLAWSVHCSYMVLLIPWLVLEYYVGIGSQIFTTKIFVIVKNSALFTISLSFMYVMSTYTWYLSLEGTTVGANTGISNSSSVFVFIFAIFLIKERVTAMKIFSILSCVTGIVIVAIYSPEDPNSMTISPIAGYTLAVVSTLLYSVYQVVFKKYADSKNGGHLVERSDEHLPINEGEGLEDDTYISDVRPKSSFVQSLEELMCSFRFLTLTSFWNILLFWPIIPILDYFGVEQFQVPNGSDMEAIATAAALDLTSNFALLFGIICTDPFFISIGSLLTFPAGLLADWIIYSVEPTVLGSIGSVFIVISFLALNSGTMAERCVPKSWLESNKGKFSTKYIL